MLSWVTDGGLETDLLFHRGIDLPEFAAFPLVEDDRARVLRDYYADYVGVAEAFGAGLVLETPTWRANPDWGARLGYDAAALDRVNRRAVELVRGVDAREVPVQVSGVVGPRGDGYVAAGHSADEAAEYHLPQCASFAAAGVDVVHAMTLSEPAEAIGVVQAARQVGLPVGVSFRWRPTAPCRTARRLATRCARWTTLRPPTGTASTAPIRPTSAPALTVAVGSSGCECYGRTPRP